MDLRQYGPAGLDINSGCICVRRSLFDHRELLIGTSFTVYLPGSGLV